MPQEPEDRFEHIYKETIGGEEVILVDDVELPVTLAELNFITKEMGSKKFKRVDYSIIKFRQLRIFL
jgi:hypothetical protein